MQQHAVPQNISSYEFKLVGDMTLKQFFQLAGGVIVAIIIYRLPIPIDLIKYILMTVAVLIGVGMAFVPIQGRPFTQWISAFVRAIYAPTEFTYQPSVNTPSTQAPDINPPPVVPLPPITAKTEEPKFIQSDPTPEKPLFQGDQFPPPPPPPQVTKEEVFKSPAIPAEATNILTGTVLDSSDNPIESATIEVIDTNTSLPVRALRSNKLGKFQIAIPLSNGKYTLHTEKDGYSFSPLEIIAKGEVINPISIKSS